MCRLRKLANKDDKVCYPGQYDNEHVGMPNHPLFRSVVNNSFVLELEIACSLDGVSNMETAP